MGECGENFNTWMSGIHAEIISLQLTKEQPFLYRVSQKKRKARFSLL